MPYSLLERDIMFKLDMALTVHSAYNIFSMGSQPEITAEVESQVSPLTWCDGTPSHTK
jgi:hypothetical protein